jgi:enoyl-CoA hydratase/carnithine racemase
MSDLLRLHIDGPVARITLARAEKLNALTVPMLDALDAACAQLERSPGVRAVVLDSANPKAFCSGADIAAWGALSPGEMWRSWTRIGHRIFDRLATLPQPTIAAIHGLALGGGLELALACDLRVAAANSSFALPEATVGAIPGWGGTRRLARLIGPGRAKHMIFRSARIDAATALAWGLVEDIVDDDALAAHVHDIALEIASRAPEAVQLAKQLVDIETGGLSAETMAAGLALALPNGREGADAFKTKRTPCFADPGAR